MTTRLIGIRVTDDEYSVILAASEKSGLNVSALIRSGLDYETARILESDLGSGMPA